MKPAKHPHGSALVLAFLGLALAPLLAWSQAGTGTKFRVTSKMEMAGFSMPGQTSEVCGPKDGGAQSLVPKQDNCRVENYRASGSKITYDMVCTGKDAMSGRGEFEMLGGGAYRGKMVATMEGETMTMSFEGKRIGDCNYATESPAAKAQQMLGKTCGEILANDGRTLIHSSQMFGPGSMCASKKAAYCAKVTPLAGDLGYLRQQQQMEAAQKMPAGYSQWDAYAVCGLPRVTVLAKACTRAEAAGDYDFIGALCPDRIALSCTKAEPNRDARFLVEFCSERAATLAKQHCTARSFTAGFEGPYAAFCNRYAAKRLDQRNPAEAPPAQKPKLRDRLRGVIGG